MFPLCISLLCAYTNRACPKSGGITLLTKTNFLLCKISKDVLNTKNDLFVCDVYIPPEKSIYFENEMIFIYNFPQKET